MLNLSTLWMERLIFDIPQYSFAMSLLSPLEELRGPSFEQTNLKNLIHPRVLCAKFGWNWSSIGLYFRYYIMILWYYLTWNRVWPFICINLNLNNISNNINALSLYISIWFLPWKMYGSTIELIWIPFKQGCFVASFQSEIGPYY